MKRFNLFHKILEVIVILGNIVVGMTLLTYIFQGVSVDKLYLGSIVIASALIQVCDYFTLKFTIRRRSLQKLIAAIIFAVVGVLFIFLNIEMDLVCVLLGAFTIAFSFVNLTSSSANLAKKPLFNSAKIIIQILNIVFSIFLIVRMESFIYTYITYLGIAMLAEALILIIEFIIHCYQN